MSHDWKKLIELTQGKELCVERVRVLESGISLEGAFTLPRLAQLSEEDQVFVMGFLRCQGSIKDMERLFGISYPTVKARLAKINEQLGFIDIETSKASDEPSNAEILDRLERGEITPQEAIRSMRK